MKMTNVPTRRGFLKLGATALGASALARPLTAAEPAAPSPQVAAQGRKAAVGLVRGEDRRRIVAEALAAVEDQILPVLKTRSLVVIKPNIVNPVVQLAATHVDTLSGVLDFLAPRFKGKVVIAESSAGNTTSGYEQYGYQRLM